MLRSCQEYDSNYTMPPNYTEHPYAFVSWDTQTLAQGAPFTLSATASGTAPLAYQWRLNGANLALATSSTLTIPSAQTTNSGNYTLVVTNNYGSVTSAIAAVADRQSSQSPQTSAATLRN